MKNYFKNYAVLIALSYVILSIIFEFLTMHNELNELPKEILIPILFFFLPATIISTTSAILCGSIFYYLGFIPSFFIIKWIITKILKRFDLKMYME